MPALDVCKCRCRWGPALFTGAAGVLHTGTSPHACCSSPVLLLTCIFAVGFYFKPSVSVCSRLLDVLFPLERPPHTTLTKTVPCPVIPGYLGFGAFSFYLERIRWPVRIFSSVSHDQKHPVSTVGTTPWTRSLLLRVPLRVPAELCAQKASSRG